MINILKKDKKSILDNIFGWQGYFKIKTKSGIIVLKNRIMDDALDQLILSFYNSPPDMELAYLAIGDSSLAVTNSQSTLDNEVFRAPFLTKARTGIGESTAIALITDTDYDGPIEEIGVFAGSGASGSVDTGLMISRVLWSYTKTATEELQFTRIDKIIRG